MVSKENLLNQKCSELELETIQKLIEREAEERDALERRYTDDDLIFAWGCGYDSRKREEIERQEE